MGVPEDLLVHLRRARDAVDRRYAEDLDLTELADLAGMSRFHFLRCFAATYGLTPGAYLAQRRVERAQQLLRSTRLSVTEVCDRVGYASLGSFSSRFSALVGVSPSAYQARYARSGPPLVPGCYVLMHGLSDVAPDRRAGSATTEKPTGPVPA
jgi:AraC-like DNA-binding protein